MGVDPFIPFPKRFMEPARVHGVFKLELELNFGQIRFFRGADFRISGQLIPKFADVYRIPLAFQLFEQRVGREPFKDLRDLRSLENVGILFIVFFY